MTAIASGTESTGIRAEFPGTPGTYNVDVENTIASGSLADLAAYESALGAPKIVVSHSNFDLTSSDPKESGGRRRERATRKRRRCSSTPAPATSARRPARRRSTPASPTSSGRSTWPGIPGCSEACRHRRLSSSSRPWRRSSRCAIKPGSFRAGTSPARSPAAGKSGGAPRGDGHLHPLGGGQRRIQRRAEGHGPQGRQTVREADRRQQRPQEMLPLQAREGRLLRLRGCRREQLQVLRAARRQALKPGSYRLTGAAGSAVRKPPSRSSMGSTAALRTRACGRGGGARSPGRAAARRGPGS